MEPFACYDSAPPWVTYLPIITLTLWLHKGFTTVAPLTFEFGHVFTDWTLFRALQEISQHPGYLFNTSHAVMTNDISVKTSPICLQLNDLYGEPLVCSHQALLEFKSAIIQLVKMSRFWFCLIWETNTCYILGN